MMKSTEHKVGFYSLGRQRILKYGLKCMSAQVSLMLPIYNTAYSMGLFEGLGHSSYGKSFFYSV